jgi:hypothetical protein
MRRLALLLATILVAGSVLTSAGVASAAAHVKPVITATEATFTIPASPSGTWRLALVTKDTPPNHLLGVATGTSGTLSVTLPQTVSCKFQADVTVRPTGAAHFRFYSGLIATVPGCGQSGTGQRYTPGYWKNHGGATTPLLPQPLGKYSVTTFLEAQAVFDAMKCSDAVNCLAGHLLAAELDVANGSSICISGVIFQANALLKRVNYTGPGSYTITAKQRANAIALQTALDNYTNDSTSTSCF